MSNDQTHEANDDLTATKPKRNPNTIWLTMIGFGLLLFVSCGLYQCGRLRWQQNAVGTTGEEIVAIVTDEVDSDFRPLSRESKTTLSPTAPIYTAVFTAASDPTVVLRWFNNEQPIFEGVGQAQDGFAVSTLVGTEERPLPSGNYKVEIYFGRNSPAAETVTFTVAKAELAIVPPQPTPPNHVALEPQSFLELPFAFDETWLVAGNDVNVNEVKIVFLPQGELFAIVVESDRNLRDLSEAQLTSLAKPIAIYAVANGYLEKAETLKINGRTYELRKEPMSINFINPETPNYLRRARFDVEPLLRFHTK